MLYKAIFRGNFQFGNQRSFGKVVQSYHHKVEILYKGDVLLKQEQLFSEENFSLNLSNIVVTGTEKSVKNTAYLLETLSQFALSGQAWCWMVNEGKVIFSMQIFPSADKTPVMAYMEGYQLSREPGREQEALLKFKFATEKFDRHWTALERKGYVQMLMKDFDSALESFRDSIAIHPDQPDAYSGMARVYMQLGEWKSASDMLDKAIKNSVPHQTIYWQSRRIKGECLVHLEEYDKAHFELNLCVKRQFNHSDPNFAWRKSAMMYFSRVLFEQRKEKEAVDMFNKAMDVSDALEPVFSGKQSDFYEQMMLLSGRKLKSSEEKTNNSLPVAVNN